jgi:hypothetical protein
MEDDAAAVSEKRTSMSAENCSYEYWLGPREAKYSGSGVERSVRPSATIRRARAVLDIIGVTKVADVTDLDRVGIPNFMTVRPHDVGPGMSYYNGKGTTRAGAHAGRDDGGDRTSRRRTLCSTLPNMVSDKPISSPVVTGKRNRCLGAPARN